MPSPPYLVRFAPSPPGPLHLCALLAACGRRLLARPDGGQWCGRMEEHDLTRAGTG
ncbi:glutamate--tRNA ligase family protein, partial [Xanthomonas perforans]